MKRAAQSPRPPRSRTAVLSLTRGASARRLWRTLATHLLPTKHACVAAGLLIVVALAPHTTAGCDDDSWSTDAATDVGTDVARHDGNGLDAGTEAAPIPCSVDGYWLDDAYDPNCGFCYAKSTPDLPPAMQWGSCDSTATPSGMTCRQMVEDWPIGQGALAGFIAPTVLAWVQSDGTVTFSLARFSGPNAYAIVADADGPVHQAIAETATSTCALAQSDIRDGRVVYRIYDSEISPLSSYGGGSYGAAIGDLRPHVYTHYHEADAGLKNDRAYYVSALGLFEDGINNPIGSYVHLYDWSTANFKTTVESAAEDNGFVNAHVWPRSDAVFSDPYMGTLYNKLRVWTPDGGASDFVTYGTDPSQGASDLGTDGMDMVWARGSGRTDGGVLFPINDVMTSPYASNPSALIPRRLRSDGYTYGTNPFIVGCGYAVHASTVVANEIGLLLVRISDGQSWELTSPGSALWIWTQPLALTCSELFALVQTKTSTSQGHFTVVRVRLDSLGPGVPPD